MIRLTNASTSEYFDFNFTWPGGVSASVKATLSINHNKGRRPDDATVFVRDNSRYYAISDYAEFGANRFGWDRFHEQISDENTEVVRIFSNLNGVNDDAYVRLFWFTDEDVTQA